MIELCSTADCRPAFENAFAFAQKQVRGLIDRDPDFYPMYTEGGKWRHTVPIIMRTRYLLERDPLLKLGAREVVAEEVEGAVEVISRMLRYIEVPRNVIDESIRSVRSETQTSDRKQTLPRNRLADVSGLAEMKIECALVGEQSRAVGQSPISLHLRSKTGALVVGVRRGDRLLEQPDPSEPFQAGDVVYLVGTGDAVTRALPLFGSGTVRPPADVTS
jgi:CPA2 family monovalent cation:H+ antiporter-2